jgi:hypothetical protein
MSYHIVFFFLYFYFSEHRKSLFITWKNIDSSYSFDLYEIHFFRLFSTCEVNLEIKLVSTIKPWILIYTVYNNIGISFFFFFPLIYYKMKYLIYVKLYKEAATSIFHPIVSCTFFMGTSCRHLLGTFNPTSRDLHNRKWLDIIGSHG